MSERGVPAGGGVGNGSPVVSDVPVETLVPAVPAGPSGRAYEKPLPGATASLGGEEIVGVAAPPPGTTTRIAYARASAPEPLAPELEPVDPAASRASVNGTIASRAFTLGRIMVNRAVRDTSDRLGRTELLARKLAKALAGALVRAELLVVRVLRVGGDLLGGGGPLAHQRLAVRRGAAEGLGPGV